MQVLQDGKSAVIVTSPGRGWLRVPASAWAAFVVAVKRGDFR